MGRIDLMGQKFGRLTVIENAGSNARGSALWKCCCDCGNEIVAEARLLRSGNTKSCGCLKKDIQRKRMIKKNTTHNERYTRLYRTWAHMIWRCENPNAGAYPLYGGRGISVCREWRESFEDFRDWARRSGYNDTLSIDRIDVDGNYEPSNCRWITLDEQQNNKRNNHYLTFNGKTKTIAEWSRETGIKSSTIQRRVTHGCPVEIALTKQAKGE